jgi:hypothetical protein
MISNLLKRWRDDFATVKRQRDGFGAFRKEMGCHPASFRPTSSTDYYTCYKYTYFFLTEIRPAYNNGSLVAPSLFVEGSSRSNENPSGGYAVYYKSSYERNFVNANLRKARTD